MILEAGAALAGLWSLRGLAHLAILRGLRAPRVAHDLSHAHPGVAPDRVCEVRIPGPRGRRLAAWLVAPPDAGPHPAPAVLVMHGWGANAALMWPVVPPLHAAGLAVLLVDARCHGHSDGEAFTSLPRFAEDIAAGLAWLRQRPGIAPDRLALIGHSVGAAACLLHASRHPDVRAVVSLSAFAHPREVMRGFMAEKRLPYPVVGWYVMRHVQRVIGSRFDDIAPLNTIARVQCPVLVVHGRADSVVPAADAARLVARSGRARLLQLEGNHDLREALAPHAQTVVEFLRAAMTAGRSNAALVPDELEVLCELVPIAGQDIVELGCGAARLARALLERHPDSRVTALEVDERQHAANLAAPQAGLQFVAAGAQAIPFADASFDVALMLKSLHHVPMPLLTQALAEAARVLRPQGHLYVSEPVFAGPLNEVVRLFNDEATVRAAAQAALDAALMTGTWEPVAERFFDMPVRFKDFADFEQQTMRPTFADHRIDDAKLAQVRSAFKPHLQADGAHFTQPMHVRVLRKRL